ncbi:MAG: hypothetical protein HY519_00100 [Candidatus Aenigmarchaeota archaeon]|nr:hypothetical protein [Candidatus Aenigmarchaeota archaeon]
MAKPVLLAVAAILFFSILAFLAVADGPKAEIRSFHIIGKGIAIATTDAQDFLPLKIGIGRMLLRIGDENSTVAAGVLHLGEDQYRMRNITTGNKTFSGLLYLNGSQSGSFSISAYIKAEAEIWFGKLTIGGKDYNAYILGVERKQTEMEKGKDVMDACASNPERCRELGKGVGNACDKLDTHDCREKIADFCANNPQDPRCVAVFRHYCSGHQEDSKCRDELRKLCASDPAAEGCPGFCKEHPAICTKARLKLELEQKKGQMKEAIEEAKDGFKDAKEAAREALKQSRNQSNGTGRG